MHTYPGFYFIEHSWYVLIERCTKRRDPAGEREHEPDSSTPKGGSLVLQYLLHLYCSTNYKAVPSGGVVYLVEADVEQI